MLTKRERRRGRRPFLLCGVVRMFYSAEHRSVLFRRLEDYKVVAQENNFKKMFVFNLFNILHI